MSKWTRIADLMRFPIKIIFYAYFFIALGSLVQNDAFNTFYTFRNTYVKLGAELFIQIGSSLIKLLPILIVVRIASRRKKSGTPILIGLVGYVTFLVSTMLFQNPDMLSDLYGSFLNISYNASTMKGTTAIRYPIETGFIGAFIVGYLTRWSYIKARNRNGVSLLAFAPKDTLGYIYIVLTCIAAGFGISYVWPYLSSWLQTTIDYISINSSNPKALALYGVLDRVTAAFGLNNIIRNPFWFGVKGGSYVLPGTGTPIFGDINIYTRLTSNGMAAINYGKYVTGYYALNFFVVPAIVLALYTSISRKNLRIQNLIGIIGVCILSIVFGNSLALEMYLLFSAPVIYILYLAVVGAIFAATSFFKCTIGYSFQGDLVKAMPGNLPDFLIHIRDLNYQHQIITIILIGLVAAIIMFVLIKLYVAQFAYDFSESGKKNKIARKIVEAAGGALNIEDTFSTPYQLAIDLKDHELINFELLKSLGISKIAETNEGITLYCGLASNVVRKEVLKVIAEVKRD